MYSKESLHILKEALLILKGKASIYTDPIPAPDVGVCYNLMYTVDSISPHLAVKAYIFVQEQSIGWPHHNGANDNFVPDDYKYGKWEGPNLEMRLDLLDYLIAKCDELLDLEE